jgi:lysophospholipase L1-like esterase
MERGRRWLLVVLLALGLMAAPVPAHAASPTLVALGDSYASGVGSYVYYDDGTECYRSPFAYSSLLAGATGLQLTLAACSGATTNDVLVSQLASLKPETDYVTITVGGNDVGFRNVVTTCALPGWLGNCSAAVNAGRNTVATELGADLDRVYAAVRAKAPRAKVAVTGYPRLFNGSDCNPLTFFTAAEMAAINAGTDELNAVIRARAGAAGFRYVAVRPAFVGHAVCDARPWINNLTVPTVNSFHQNIAGHTAYATLTAPALFGAPVARSAAEPVARSDVRLPDVRSAAGPTRLGPRLPDLSSPAVARAAARARVTKAELRQLRRAQRDGASNAVLDRLDARITAAAKRR